MDFLFITILELDTFWVSIYRELGNHSLAARCELVLSAKILVGVRRRPRMVHPRIVHPTVCLYSTYQTGQGTNGVLYNGPLPPLPHLFSSFSPPHHLLFCIHQYMYHTRPLVTCKDIPITAFFLLKTKDNFQTP